jgi:hypothetical protein
MTNLSLTVRYRPARIGWCVRDGNWEDLRSALRLTQIFWGGAFNPVIPVGASANQLIKKFRVDVLFPVNKSPGAVAFAGSYDSLRWPLFETELIGKFGNAPNFLDVSHPLRRSGTKCYFTIARQLSKTLHLRALSRANTCSLNGPTMTL